MYLDDDENMHPDDYWTTFWKVFSDLLLKSVIAKRVEEKEIPFRLFPFQKNLE